MRNTTIFRILSARQLSERFMLGRTPLIGWATMLALLFRGGIALAHGPDQPPHQRVDCDILALDESDFR
jgi:hypothetical protein